MNKSNGLTDNDLPYFIFSTGGDSTGNESQSVIATKDPSSALAGLNVNIVGLGETTLLKQDADNKNTDTQGDAWLTGSVWGLYKAGTDTLVKYSDGQNGYPVTLTNGEKVDDKEVQIKLTDVTKGVGLKTLSIMPTMNGVSFKRQKVTNYQPNVIKCILMPQINLTTKQAITLIM